MISAVVIRNYCAVVVQLLSLSICLVSDKLSKKISLDKKWLTSACRLVICPIASSS